MPTTPAAAVREPNHVVKTGKTPVLEGAEWRRLIDTIPTETVCDLRDRTLIATLTHSFARQALKADGPNFHGLLLFGARVVSSNPCVRYDVSPMSLAAQADLLAKSATTCATT
jgi:hypothetical protein